MYFRYHHPAEAPAGHAEVFGKTVDNEYIVTQGERRLGFVVIDQPMIDLIDNDAAAFLFGNVDDLLQIRCRDQGAGGIGGLIASIELPAAEMLALDLDADIFKGMSNADIFNYIKDNLTFDQLIWEFGDDESPSWVHVSYKKNEENRGRCLRAYRDNKGVYYKPLL